MNKTRGELAIMKILQQFLACVALAGALQPVLAHQVNECIDGSGRKVMTDRPCENPATERDRDQQRRSKGVGVEQVRAPDIFETRTKLGNNGKPLATDAAGGAAKPQGQGR